MLLGCVACSPADVPNADGQPTSDSSQTGDDADSASEDLPSPDDLPVEMCEDAGGTRFDLADSAWVHTDPDVESFDVALVGPEGSYLAARSDGQWQLAEVDLSTGVTDYVMLEMHGSGLGTFAWDIQGHLLNFQWEDHSVAVAEFDGLDVINEFFLEDNHPRVGWDGGSTRVPMARGDGETLTVFGESTGDENPEGGGSLQVRWLKRYTYEGVASGTDFVWPSEEATNDSRGVFDGDDVVYGRGPNTITRVNADGSVEWSLDEFFGQIGPSAVDSLGVDVLWRHTVASPLHPDYHEETVEAMSVVAVGDPDSLTLVWQDKHCTRRLAHFGGIVRGGTEVVVSATTDTSPSIDSTVWFHRVSRETGEVLKTRFITRPRDMNLRSTVFEGPGDEIGILLHGAEKVGEGQVQGRVYAFYPFD